jgi:DNA-binding transcriptional MerR regulator
MASAAQVAHEMPEKNLFRIGEVSRLTETKQFVLRFWESEFPMLQPVKSPSGHRLYRREDIQTVLTIKRLLYVEGFTIAGARKHLEHSDGPPQTLDFDAALHESRAMIKEVKAKPAACTHREQLLTLREELAAVLTLLEGE